ncbi:molybdopterin cofactor-binding domain-containing protein, partial [Sciscionella sediminilitoris]|uniref:molybdopterin cofactor-binding domain-containing protein n=1 Tax=Sciscionella sediminilitoris TaxID=1445613 RepID=UPI00056558FA
PLDPETGQGDAHVQYAFAAHRAIVDVDTELGLIKVIALDCAQDVGKAINPQAITGQIHGGSTQGLGLAVMEEIQTHNGTITNPSFTDYLIPTILDTPPMHTHILE